MTCWSRAVWRRTRSRSASSTDAVTLTPPTRCVHPTVGRRRPISTYTVLGFAGYLLASALGTTLALHWQFGLGERLVALVAPPAAFIVVVSVATVLYPLREPRLASGK